MPHFLQQAIIYSLICISYFPLYCQSEIPGILEAALHSTEWENYYCKDERENVLLKGIVSNSRIPLYNDLIFQGRELAMCSSIRKEEQHWLEIRNIRLGQDQVKINFLYDQRVKVRMKLIRNEEGDWVETSSIFRQKFACGGKKRKKAFSWSF
ncbi:MAG: hypothetical protein AAFY45_29485 [Bacteroidota bacterium]